MCLRVTEYVLRHSSMVRCYKLLLKLSRPEIQSVEK